MATNVIDVAFHGTAFPTTYVGPGDIVGNIGQANPANALSGYFTAKGNEVSIPLGFAPTYVEVVDETNVIIWRWYRGLSATKCIKQVTAGTTTVDATSAIVVSTDLAGNGTVTLSAALAANNAKLVIMIRG